MHVPPVTNYSHLMELHVNPLVHLINIMDHHHLHHQLQIHHHQLQIHHHQTHHQLLIHQTHLTLPQKEFYKLLVKIVLQDVLHVKVVLHVNHVVQDIPYQDQHVMLISQENYKLVMFS